MCMFTSGQEIQKLVGDTIGGELGPPTCGSVMTQSPEGSQPVIYTCWVNSQL